MRSFDSIVNQTLLEYIGRIEKQAKYLKEFIITLPTKIGDYETPNSRFLTEELLSEGEIRTYPMDFTRRYVLKNLQGLPPQYFQDFGDGSCQVVIPNEKKYIDILLKCMQFCGYFKETEEMNEEYNLITFQFAERFPPQYPKTNIYKGLEYYHISPSFYEERILKNGLCPYSRNSSFSYPPRVHLFLSKDDAISMMAQTIAQGLYQVDDREHNNGSYSLYKVHLDDSTPIYKDNTAPLSLFTKDNIPPQNIEIVGHYQAK